MHELIPLTAASLRRYVGNWTAAAYLDWGRNAGCNMPTQTCSAYQSNTAGMVLKGDSSKRK